MPWFSGRFLLSPRRQLHRQFNGLFGGLGGVDGGVGLAAARDRPGMEADDGHLEAQGKGDLGEGAVGAMHRDDGIARADEQGVAVGAQVGRDADVDEFVGGGFVGAVAGVSPIISSY